MNRPYTVTRQVDPAWTSGLRWTRMQPVTARSFDAMQVNFGLTLAAADDSLRSQLEIAPGQGVVVIGVKPGSLVDQAGLKVNDVILDLAGQRVMGVNQARGMLLAVEKGEIAVKLIREGKPCVLTLVGLGHPEAQERGEFFIGIPTSPVDATLRSHLGSLPAEVGLLINDVVPDSPAAKAGLKKNDILVSLDGKPIKSAEELIKQVQASEGKPIGAEVIRVGKPLKLLITPARRNQAAANPAKPADPFLTYYQYYVPRTGILAQGGDVNYLQSGPILGRAPGTQPDPANPQAFAPFQVQFANPNAEGNAQMLAALEEIRESIESLRKAVEALEKSGKK